MNAAEQKANRSDIELLLPWHAAGTLSRRDTQRVEAALASDPELARRYELVREELGQTIHLNETLGAPSARAMQALFAKIDAEPARRPAPSLNLGARIAEFFASLSPRTLAWSASAAALAILLQAGLLAGIALKEKSAGGYETASAPKSVTGEGAYALIRFQPQASAADVRVSGNQQTQHCGRTVRRRAIPRTHRGQGAAEGGSRPPHKTLQEDKVVGFIATTQ